MKQPLKSAALFVLLAGGITAVGCGLLPPSQEYIPANLTPEPITSAIDGLPVAEQVACNWDIEAYLTRETSVYQITGETHKLVRSVYTFISGDKTQYFWVVINSSGGIEVGPPSKVEGAFVPTIPYSPEANSVLEMQAIELAWDHLGDELSASCGPLEHLTIEGTTLLTDAQVWSVSYSGHDAALGTVNIDSTTGEIVSENTNNYICP